MKKIVSLMVVMFMVASFGIAFAASSADEAKAMVEKAAAYVQANGREKAVTEFNNPKGQFVKGELYVFAWDLNGTNIANNPKQVGMNVLEFPTWTGSFSRRRAWSW